MWASYIRLGFKILLRRKFFTFISLFGIAFTLLVLMVATAILDHFLSPHPPEPHAARTLYVTRMAMKGPNHSRSSGAGYGFLDRWVRDLPDAEQVAITTMPNRFPVYHRGEKYETFLRHTDAAFWQVMRFDFLEGAPFTAEDDRDGRRVAVINESTRERFFGDSIGIGELFQVDGNTFRVVGVVRDVPISRLMSFAEVWVPIGATQGDAYQKDLLGDFVGIILARDRRDFPALKGEVQARLRQVPLPDSRFDTLYGAADTLFEAWARAMFGVDGADAQPEWLQAALAGAVLLFLLLPTLNLVNLTLSRILERAPEIGVRKAFGAPSRSLVVQFVAENVLLTLVGAALGLVLAAAALAGLNASGLIPYAAFRLNLRVFAYGVLLAALFGIVAGVYPAWRMSRFHPVEALRGRLI